LEKVTVRRLAHNWELFFKTYVPSKPNERQISYGLNGNCKNLKQVASNAQNGWNAKLLQS